MRGRLVSNPLEELYKYLNWPMRPGEEAAEIRFWAAVDFFEEQLKTHPGFEGIRRRNTIRILDVCSGTGIGGVAAAKAFVDQGYKVFLVALDKRRNDLVYVEKWLEYAGIKEKVSYTTQVGAGEEAPLYFKDKFGLIMIWGSSMPHFDPWRAAKMFAGIRELTEPWGTLLVEQWDIAGKLIQYRLFKDILVEGGIREDGTGLVSICAKYNVLKGTFERAYYKIPGWMYLFKTENHLWYLSTLATIIWMFYRKIDIKTQKPRGEKKPVILRPVLIAWEPRETTVPYKDLSIPDIVEKKI